MNEDVDVDTGDLDTPPQKQDERSQDNFTPHPTAVRPYFRVLSDAIASTATAPYNRAMLNVQMEIESLIIADKANPFTKSRFSSLGNLLATVRPVLNKHGFLLKQFSGGIQSHGNTVKRWYTSPILTLITHVNSGEWEAVFVELPTETTVYSIGSSLTFGKRYGLQSYLCIATVDDDGAAVIQNRIDETHNSKAVDYAVEEIRKCKALPDLNKWLEENRDALNNIPDGPGLTSVRLAFSEKKKTLEAAHELLLPDAPAEPKRKPKDKGMGS